MQCVTSVAFYDLAKSRSGEESMGNPFVYDVSSPILSSQLDPARPASRQLTGRELVADHASCLLSLVEC